ncbi:MAG: putative lipid II flippase FtsW [Actinobacteria bacterium]|nr:putative lipid II flippase FtsW [Actinomycetota bacterium]
MSVAVERMPSPLARRFALVWRRWSLAGQARPSVYVLLLTTVGVLNVVGVVMVLSASSVASLTNYGSAWYFFERQVLWTLLGALVFAVTARIDYHVWRRWVIPMLVVCVALLVLVLVPGIGVYVAGSRRWLGSGAWRFQPTEPAKLALLIFSADVLARRAREVHDWRRAVRPVLLVFGLIAVLVMRQPDMASTIVLALIVGAALVVGGVRLRHLAVLGGAGVSAAALLAMIEPYRRARMLSFLNPVSDPGNTGYQISQSLIALGSGGWTGVGLGAGRSKWLFLPNAHTDFIFAIIGEEVGLLGCLLVVALFAAFGVLGTRIALRAPDRFGTLLAAGITVWVVGQAVINIGGVVGLLPVSGVPLPFVSFGGSALVFTMAAAGLLSSVARRTS